MRLANEFRQMDKNGDGLVTKQELDLFLQGKGVDDGHRGTIVTELFEKCDIGQNGAIELDEFVGHYLDTSNKLKERKDDIKKCITDLMK